MTLKHDPLRVIFATDGSEGAMIATKWVATHFQGAPYDAILLHAIRMSIEDALHNGYADLATAAEGILNKTQAALSKEVTNISAVGTAAPTIAQISREQHADLIVMGHSGHASLGGLGSTAFEVLHQANIPVLLVPREIADHIEEGPLSRPLKIVLAVNGSKPSDEAAEWLNQNMGNFAVEIHLFCVSHDVVPSPMGMRETSASAGIPVGAVAPVMGGVPGGGVYWLPTEAATAGWEEAARLAQQETENTLERSATLLTNCPPVTREAGSGAPAEAIRNYAESVHADLIVMGRRDHSMVGNIFNSVSYSVVQHSKVPVLVVSSEVEQDEA